MKKTFLSLLVVLFFPLMSLAQFVPPVYSDMHVVTRAEKWEMVFDFSTINLTNIFRWVLLLLLLSISVKLMKNKFIDQLQKRNLKLDIALIFVLLIMTSYLRYVHHQLWLSRQDIIILILYLGIFISMIGFVIFQYLIFTQKRISFAIYIMFVGALVYLLGVGYDIYPPATSF